MNDITQQIASPDVILMEVMIYCVVSLVIILALDYYAVKQIGSRRMPAYRMLKPWRSICILVVAVVTMGLGFLCLLRDLEMTRAALTYVGLPYFLSVFFFMIKSFRVTRSHQKWRGQ